MLFCICTIFVNNQYFQRCIPTVVNPNMVLAGLLTNTRAWKGVAHETDFNKIETDTLISIKGAQEKVTELIEEVSCMNILCSSRSLYHH